MEVLPGQGQHVGFCTQEQSNMHFQHDNVEYAWIFLAFWLGTPRRGVIELSSTT
jgi:hypothetical protein